MIIVYILAALVSLGVIAAVAGVVRNRKLQGMLERGEIAAIPEAQELVSAECCGQHEVCERESLYAAVSKKIEYYDDEDLDCYKGKLSDEYTPEMEEDFREVFYTLRETEVAGWLRSLYLREIELPEGLKDEALLIVGERRSHS